MGSGFAVSVFVLGGARRRWGVSCECQGLDSVLVVVEGPEGFESLD